MFNSAMVQLVFFFSLLLFDVKSIIVSQLEFEKKEKKICLELGSVSNIHTSCPKQKGEKS